MNSIDYLKDAVDSFFHAYDIENNEKNYKNYMLSKKLLYIYKQNLNLQRKNALLNYL